MWKEAKDTVLTPRLSTPTSGPNRRSFSSASLAAAGTGGGRAVSPSSRPAPMERKPSAQRMGMGSAAGASSGGSNATNRQQATSPSLMRSVPLSAPRGSALTSARVTKEPSLARSSPGRSVSPSRSQAGAGAGAGVGTSSSFVSGRPRTISPSKPQTPSTAGRRFTFEQIPTLTAAPSPPASTYAPSAVSAPQPDALPPHRSSPTPAGGSSSGQRFCHQCGFDLRTCKVPPKFCRECGARINASPTPPGGL